MLRTFIVLALACPAAALLRQPPLRNPDTVHKDGATQAEDWGQEYGEKQYAWNKDAAKPGMDNFDKNLARDANSPLDKKHPLPASPAGAPGAAPVAAAPSAPMDPTMLEPHGTMHVNGDTQASDWGQEYGPKQFQWNKDEIKPGLDDFDRNIVRDANSPLDKKNPAPGAPAAAPAAEASV
eukprot:gnl/MRDRNA2_/MRDRNA2_88014_c0_seq1.p2 gnl/MRDRNA2_/MRDRNA2_88014_c0~~gnl/MRDRNA2_/MRDRNA2_88014_c0_seq1.p2  ORF type:complete len:180 (-),score=57.90 gnl/MRDRNA2_/MRDRNA2_88014_c0_seq1:198-737(-)